MTPSQPTLPTFTSHTTHFPVPHHLQAKHCENIYPHSPHSHPHYAPPCAQAKYSIILTVGTYPLISHPHICTSTLHTYHLQARHWTMGMTRETPRRGYSPHCILVCYESTSLSPSPLTRKVELMIYFAWPKFTLSMSSWANSGTLLSKVSCFCWSGCCWNEVCVQRALEFEAGGKAICIQISHQSFLLHTQ